MWTLLLFGLLLTAENWGCIPCNVTLWQLRYQGYTVSASDMETESECEELKSEIDPQTKGFESLECVEVWTVRYKL